MLEKETTKFAEDINNLIDANYNTYKDISRITSDFRLEKGTTKSYNGRQILEMLQNADDANTDIVSINLDRQNKVLSISNNGNSFTVEEGIASLMVAGTSSKKKEFIGNKGLGFRSILNWVSEVKIKTKEEIVVFSESIAKEEFEKLSIENQEKLIINNQDRLSEKEVPFAILAIPRVVPNQEVSLFETTIELTFKEEVDGEKIIEKIEEQLNLLAPEILLFLNHTNTISIVDSENLLTKSFNRTANEIQHKISINESTWNIEDSEEVFYKIVNDKEQYFNYKIAWQDDLSDIDSKFFTHFPTQENTHLPFLIHATFDLDPSRNHLNRSQENLDLLSEIAKSIGEIAVHKIRKERSDWNAYKFLSPERVSDNKLLIDFYTNLEELRDTLEIYPCVDGSYSKKEDVVYYNAEFSNWVLRNNVEEFFPNLMLPVEFEEVTSSYYYVNPYAEYSFSKWLEIMKLVSSKLNNIKERALLLKLLIDKPFKEIHNSNIKLPLLTDTSSERIIISENKQAFILSKKDIEQYIIPDKVEISFMSGELYEELLVVLEREISAKWNGTEHKSRPLKRVISTIVNIGSNDITDVIRNIVTTSEREMKNSEGDTRSDIAIKLVESLFSIYQVNPERRNSIKLNISLLNKNLDLCDARDLYLGVDYELGKSTSIIFKEIFTDNDYLVGNEFWQLEKGGYEYLENFFGWLGVNRISKTKTKSEYLNRDEVDDYTNYVFSCTKTPENKSHKDYSVIEITDFAKITSNENFSIEVLIAWLISDTQISNQLSFQNSDSFSYKYNTKVTPVNYKPSYVYYQIKELYLTKLNKQFIVDSEFPRELGYNTINFEHPIFKELGIQENDIITILHQLQISLAFNDLDVEDVFQIIKKLPKTDPEGKYARKVYNLAFKYFKTKEHIDFNAISKDFSLLARNKNFKEYVNVENVYYSDNSTLPSKIAEQFWMFDFPKRAGESQISRFYGVKTFKDVQLKINKESIIHSNVSIQFEAWLQKIKPFILAYRLSTIKNSIEKEQAQDLKNNDIQLVSILKYEIENGEEKQLLPGEFLPQPNDKGYYLCVNSISTLENLKDTPSVCEAFAEILCMLFKVNDHKDDYRAIFKDRPSLKDSKYLLEVKSLNESFSLAQELLGISNSEIDFWRKIYKLKGFDFPKNSTDSNELAEQIVADTGFRISKNHKSIDYENFDNEEGVDFLNTIVEYFEISLTKLFDTDSDGLLNVHKQNFETTLRDYKKYFDACLWEELNANPKRQKNLIKYQENYENLISSKEVEKTLFDNRFKLSLDYTQILKDEVSTLFDFELKEEQTNTIALLPENKQILNEHKIEEVDIEDAEIRSLLYFKNNEEDLKKALEVEKQETSDTELNPNTTEKLTGEIIYSSSEKVVPKVSSNKGGKRGGWNHSDKDVKQNKKAGKKAEERVYNSLMESEDVTDVEWVSSFSNTSDKSDNKHYDIRYKPANQNNWKYLEVKSFNGTYFHLSKSEMEEAKERDKDFEIALVMSEKIHILRDYFKEDIDFDNNNLFYATPADYIITLKVKKENE